MDTTRTDHYPDNPSHLTPERVTSVSAWTARRMKGRPDDGAFRHLVGDVGVGHRVPEADGGDQPVGERLRHVARRFEPPERIGVVGRRAQLRPHAGRDGNVDHDLDHLPEVEQHRVGRVRA